MSATANVPKRVLMTADTVGGVWTYAIELARALAEHGVEVGLATMGARMNLAQKAEAATLPNLKVFESCFKLEWMEDPRADVERAGNWLLELENSFRPDLVHLNSYSHGAFPWQAPKIIFGHSCVLSWWRAVHSCEAPPEWDEYREAVMAGLHGAELLIAPSKAMMSSLVEHYGPFKASTVIYNGRRFPVPQHHARHDVILASGRLWDAGKNINALADIAANLPWPVMIAGQESDSDGRSNPIKNLSYMGQLTSSEMADSLARASIFTLPARYESFGLSVLEAALAGCALVLGDIPSLREIWGDAALFVNPEDSANLERTLKDLINNRDEIVRLAAAAQQRARQFTPEKMADEYLRAYTQVLRAHTPMRTAVQSTFTESVSATSGSNRADRQNAIAASVQLNP